MLRFIPVMIISGRTCMNRFVTVAFDSLIGLSVWGCIAGFLPAFTPVCIALILLPLYLSIGYRQYFMPVRKYPVKAVRQSRDYPFVYLVLLTTDDQEIHLKTKTPHGAVYQMYVLFVYMWLARELTLYARKIKAEQSK